MAHRIPSFVALVVTASGCAAGPSALEYGLPADRDLRYSYADTTTVGISVMGQSMEMAQRGVAEYAVSFSPAPAGVNVTMSLSRLEGALSQPMGAPVRFDEDDVEGVLVFSLDREGNSVIAERPQVGLEASQFVSGFTLANHFFPGLPGRAASVGDSWVDTVSYSGSEGTGDRSETAVLTYSVLGDTTVAGRSLMKIGVEGSSESHATVDVQGMSVRQTGEVQIEGHVLWDAEAGVMVERRSEARGSGTASVPIAPAPLPIQIRSIQTIRLQGM